MSRGLIGKIITGTLTVTALGSIGWYLIDGFIEGLKARTVESVVLGDFNNDENQDVKTRYANGREEIRYGGFQDSEGPEYLTKDEIEQRLNGIYRADFEFKMREELARYSPTTQPITGENNEK